MSDIESHLLSLMTTPLISILLNFTLEHEVHKKLAESPKTSQELSGILSLDADKLNRALFALTFNGIYTFNEQTYKWSNSPLTDALLDDHKCTLFRWNTCPYFYKKLAQKVSIIKDVQHKDESCESVFVEAAENPDLLKLFQDAMTIVTHGNINEIVQAIDLTSASRVLDIGGGEGGLICELVKANHHITGGNLDREENRASNEELIQSLGLGNKINFFSGNFFVTIPQGFDTLTIKHVLHDWNDEDCLKILTNCRNALEIGNKLYIIDMVLNNTDPNRKLQRFFDVKMMILGNAKERTEENFENLLRQAGFRISSISKARMDSVIEAVAI
ncbi:unnamed protein product [Blepharisma stoltei]|uniref:O-methyltransferase C-terminal domain-containing protein n=1 Tax=Blepharisma stoltei TaxID=1481888 RepID=A0AAU9IZ04_9CILI|nr:unnamed protein product [Blepharisma stoltei]